MYKTTSLTLKKVSSALLVGAMAVLLLALSAVPANAAAPAIQYFQTNPNVINLERGQVAKTTFTTTAAGKFQLEVLDGNSVVKTLEYYGPADAETPANDYTFTWNGRDNWGRLVPAKTYEIQLYYYSTDFGLFASDFVTVVYEGTPEPSTEIIIDDYVYPSVFDPHTEDTEIRFTTNEHVDSMRIYIEKDGITIRNLLNESDKPANNYYMPWDGRNNGGGIVAEGTYRYVIVADSDMEAGYVTVEYEEVVPVVPNITNYSAAPNPFNPNNQDTTVTFDTNTQAEVTLEIYDGTIKIETLYDGMTLSAGSHDGAYNDWDGTDNGVIVDPGTYVYKITAVNADGSDYVYGSVVVEYDVSPTAPNVTSIDVNPESFDPTLGQDALLTYSLNTCAYVRIEAIDSVGGVEEVLVNSRYECAGSHSEIVEADGYPQGFYDLLVTATNSGGEDEEEVTVHIENDDLGERPHLSDLSVNPYSFDPSDNETSRFEYDMDEDADVTVKIFDDNDNVVVVLRDAVATSSGNDHAVVWDGEDDSNDVVDDGLYYFKVYAANGHGSDSAQMNVRVDTDGGSSSDDPELSDVSVYPSRFDPEDYEEAELEYTLENCADVTVTVYDDDDDFVVELYDGYKCDGTYTLDWDGEDDDNDVVRDGDYYFEIVAENGDGRDTEREDVEVDTDGDSSNDDDPEIQDLEVDPEVFDIDDDDELEIEFRLTEDADVTIEIRDDDGDLVYEIIDDRSLDSGRHTYEWDGEDEDGDEVRDGDYEVYVRAENSEGRDTAREDFEVDEDGGSNDDYCAGYVDVYNGDKYCVMIEYVTDLGIFQGYPDGSFQPYQPINRAETTKVVLAGFDYPILSGNGTNLGFWDVNPNAWYMPFLRTGLNYGIIQGYPDGSFQPARTVNRVELLKIFLESSNVYVPNCTIQPYADTPVQADTQWYIDYACFAKTHNLLDADAYGMLNPSEPMTRGDVAMLFYRFSQTGLNYGYSQYSSGYTAPNYYVPSGSYNTDRPEIQSLLLDDYRVDEGEGMRIEYDLTDGGEVTVEILDDDDDVVRTLLDEQYRTAGKHTVSWDGDDDDNDELEEGDYTVKIKVENNEGSDKDEVDFEIDSDDDDLKISKLEVDPGRFDPDNEDAEITFRITERADVTIRVYDDDDDLVVELWDEVSKSAGTYDVDWDGEDDDNDVVSNGDYTIEVYVEYGREDDEETVEVEVRS